MSDNRYQRTYPISWDQLHRDARALAWRLLDKDFFRGIIAVTRGGLVPAAIIARELDIRLVDTICVSSYDWQNQKGEVKLLKGIEGDGEGWLIVDDLVAIAIVLLVGGGLMVRTFLSLQAIDPGWNPDGVVTLEVSVAGTRYAEPEKRAGLYREVYDRLAAVQRREFQALEIAYRTPEHQEAVAAFLAKRPAVFRRPA